MSSTRPSISGRSPSAVRPTVRLGTTVMVCAAASEGIAQRNEPRTRPSGPPHRLAVHIALRACLMPDTEPTRLMKTLPDDAVGQQPDRLSWAAQYGPIERNHPSADDHRHPEHKGDCAIDP